jgi:RNA polymerase sigma-70 factor (ECF subfamily)
VDSYDETVENDIERSHEAEKPRSPDQQLWAKQFSLRVEEALDALPARQRTAFLLKNHQGLSIKEIAELMETAEGTVKVHLHRAVSALRERLAEFA